MTIQKSVDELRRISTDFKEPRQILIPARITVESHDRMVALLCKYIAAVEAGSTDWLSITTRMAKEAIADLYKEGS